MESKELIVTESASKSPDDKEPDRLYIQTSDIEDYDRLKEKDSQLAGKENKDLFMMAMCIGFHEGSPVELGKSSKEGFVRIEYLKERDKSIMKAIAVAKDGSLDVLLDKRKVYSIAEQYAAGGIKLLKDKIFSGGYGSFSKKLESELIDEFKKIQNIES